MRILAVLLGCASCASAPRALPPMQLRRVILYQNGLGFFERTGHITGEAMTLRFARGELDDVLKTLTVIDRLGASVATVDVPTAAASDTTIDLGVRLAAGRVHDVAVSYAVPTPTWKAAYRVVLADGSARDGSLLQGWAMIHNASQEDWSAVSLTLATGAPMSFALDLHTPQFVSRPDATARLAPPNAIAPIEAESVNGYDRDGDGVTDTVDRCPGTTSTDDTDGCPAVGRVVVSHAEVKILQPILFRKDSDALAAETAPLLDAVAQALADTPTITRVEIQAAASADEADPWGLSLRRAVAVRTSLVARGVEASRLAAVPVGATRPGGDAARDRRADFLIAARDEHEGPLDVAHVAASAHARTKPSDVAGAVRYALSEPVSIRRGASAMVSILNRPISAEDAFLWRPDAGAPGSDRHPFRAVKLANTSGFTLEPGPIAVFARGTFVGDGLIGQLAVGQIAWVPYALEGATQVAVATTATEQPMRIAAVRRGVLTVELAGVRTTTYTIAAGHEPAAAIYLHHAKAAGFTARDLPPGSIDEGDAYLVRLPLAPIARRRSRSRSASRGSAACSCSTHPRASSAPTSTPARSHPSSRRTCARRSRCARSSARSKKRSARCASASRTPRRARKIYARACARSTTCRRPRRCARSSSRASRLRPRMPSRSGAASASAATRSRPRAPRWRTPCATCSCDRDQ